MKAELGKVYRDVASQFVGVATGRAEYLHDGPTVRLTAQKGSEALVEIWVAEGRLEPTDARSGVGFAS